MLRINSADNVFSFDARESVQEGKMSKQITKKYFLDIVKYFCRCLLLINVTLKK